MLPSIALARYRHEVIKNSRLAGPTEAKKLVDLLNKAKQDLIYSRILQETYGYNPNKIKNIPVLIGRLDEETKLKILYDPSFDASMCEQFLVQKNLQWTVCFPVPCSDFVSWFTSFFLAENL